MELQEAQNVLATAELIHGADTVHAAVHWAAGEIKAALAEKNPLILQRHDRRHYLRRPASAATRFPPRFRLHARHPLRPGHPGRQAFLAQRPVDPGQGPDGAGGRRHPRRGASPWRQSGQPQTPGAAEVLTAVFVDKANGKAKPVQADFVGLPVPDRFVFGFGMDIRGAWRHLPAIYAVQGNEPMSGATVTDFWPIGKTKASVTPRPATTTGWPPRAGPAGSRNRLRRRLRHLPPWGRRGLAVLAIDTPPGMPGAAGGSAAGGAGSIEFRVADVTALADDARAAIEKFAPDTVVCWLMGRWPKPPGRLLTDAGHAVAAYRETAHRAVAELAAGLASVAALHFVDRTAIPGRPGDIGRDTLVRYHLGKTLVDLPFAADRKNALYRKLEGNGLDLAEIRRPILP